MVKRLSGHERRESCQLAAIKFAHFEADTAVKQFPGKESKETSLRKLTFD